MASAASLPLPAPAGRLRLFAFNAVPVAVVALAVILLWYAGAVWLNADLQIDTFARAGKTDWTTSDLIAATWAQDRPLLPAPHQVLAELWKTTVEMDIGSKRSLIYHSSVTLSSTLLGFVAGGLLGVLLAVGIVHVRVLEKSLLPWVIASQTIPILAIAPMIIVVLGALGLKGLIPKSVISTYLCFFPVTIGMVKGLRAPDLLQMDLMRTYYASTAQTFWKLRWPTALPFLFASLKVAISISLVGAIIAELPTGAQAGLGARLLAGSYYGQTIQIWSALVMAALLASLLVALVGLIEGAVTRAMGGRR
ncbi:ABC transporter permease [Zavarzinia sp.]|uniref:ABC transporter permease n=1 Tax=Zavarzinia sp. TaxID=2027920 RepID=UPI0035698AAB